MMELHLLTVMETNMVARPLHDRVYVVVTSLRQTLSAESRSFVSKKKKKKKKYAP